MSELSGLLIILTGLGVLAATGGLAACCLRLTSPVCTLLAGYVIAWSWLVALTYILSPAHWLTRGSLLVGIVIGFCVAFAVWIVRGQPSPPGIGRALSRSRDALNDPAVLILAVAVTLGTLYLGALAFFTPSNDWDVLAYHLARAALWRQQHGVGHIEHVDDSRVNFFPPNAEIGQLSTMLLAGTDRYTALPQLLAYAALVLCVAGLARRIGLSIREAMYAALAFATFPVVVLQASSAMNDLVVTSFLGAAALFTLEKGRAPLLLIALSVALAIGAKYSAIIALPTLALVAAVAQPMRRWPALLLAGFAGCIAGSVWYVVNVIETGGPNPDIETGGPNPDISDQRAELSPGPVIVTMLRLGLSFIEMPGAAWPYSLGFLASAGALCVAGLIGMRRSRPHAVSLLTAAALTAAVIALPVLWDVVVRGPFKLALVLRGRDLVNNYAWVFNEKAEPGLAWYGPLGLLLLVVGSAAVIVAWRRGMLPATALAFAAAPFVLLVTLALVLTWDLWRGRFILFGMVLAAAAWGVVLRWRTIAFAGAAIGSTVLFLSLANYYGKASGLFAEPSIWGTPRWKAQTTRNGLNADVLGFVEERVPEDARIGLSLIGDHWIHPYFGPKLSRHVTLVPANGGVPPAEADWLVLAARTDVRRCPGAWRPVYANGNGWRVERRLAPDLCGHAGVWER